MSIFLLCIRWALYVAAALLGVGSAATVALAVTAHRSEERPGAWFLAGYAAVIAMAAAGLAVAARYVR